MNFEELKKKALELKEKTIKYSATKLAESSLTIDKKEELENIIKKSKTTTFENKENGTKKEYKHKSIVLFIDEKSDFFEEALYIFPVIVTKAFSQSIPFKLSKINIEGVNLSDYNIKNEDIPCLIVFEEEKNLKKISGKENILKLVKSFDLDINKLIDET